MSADALVPSGIAAVGLLPWGSHFCHFYESPCDLVDAIVPYFQAGLAHGERCLWVTCEPLDCTGAANALRAAVPDLDQRLARGDIEIVSHGSWYGRYGNRGAAEMLRAWRALECDALSRGYAGLRISGDASFVDERSWDEFSDYEAQVSAAFRRQRIVSMCSYGFGRCSCETVLDVVRNHDFALARRRGAWEVTQSAARTMAKAHIAQVNAEIDERIRQHTAHLVRELQQRDLLLQEVGHRLKNNLQMMSSLLDLQARDSADPDVRRRLRDAQGRLSSLGMVHALLQKQTGMRGLSAATLIGRLASALVTAFDPGRERIELQVAVPPEPISADQAVPLGMLLAELLTNALKHAFPDARRGVIRIDWRFLEGCCAESSCSGHVRLTVSDDGVGFDPHLVYPDGGLGRTIVEQFAAGLAATLTTSSRPGEGTRVEVGFPLERVAADVQLA